MVGLKLHYHSVLLELKNLFGKFGVEVTLLCSVQPLLEWNSQVLIFYLHSPCNSIYFSCINRLHVSCIAFGIEECIYID